MTSAQAAEDSKTTNQTKKRETHFNQYSKNCSEVLFGFFHQDIWFLEIEFHVDAAFEKRCAAPDL